MDPIRLLYTSNTAGGRAGARRQTLTFLILVADLDYRKTVDVVWCGRDGVWQRLPASYLAKTPEGGEVWHAVAEFGAEAGSALPGGIRFALHYRWPDGEAWDNNLGRDYQTRAGSGHHLADDLVLQTLTLPTALDLETVEWPVVVATDATLDIDHVSVHWSGDGWRRTRQAPCKAAGRRRKPVAGPATGLKPARLWHTRLRIGEAFRIEYCIAAHTRSRSYWDNRAGQNYRLSRPPLRVLVLNLHCYQEDDQDRKFSQIARAIDDWRADLVCLQEVAEHWNNGYGDWPSNAANIINARLSRPFHLHCDWSHLGFDRYREGVAILSRYPLERQESRYVSDSSDVYSIHSRKVVAANVTLPRFGRIDVFSAHLSWWEDGFESQFRRLAAWADARRDSEVCGTLLCGDFNVAAGSIGYRLIVEGNQYRDQYLAASAPNLYQQIYRVNDPHWHNYLAEDYRIDYIFMNKSGALKAVAARAVFTEQDYGRVSDHCGYLFEFEPR
ncbi:endonuclease [Methylomonas sp. LWB]|uniref:endonuclease/exonuclease/phosphatase family protein n=1 Tax=Methylomonas sp. LWB TaxID=1905845 RepID=UPI0008D94A2D|nr:endonuclease/exonuclease/phosphatase family protein [Methylomonas sp. LWB]OHX38040.1 endonuclease [Methylomonas sp. LWB]